jgi:prepilin-type N-terminal cleavage/methylation domain-containing protein
MKKLQIDKLMHQYQRQQGFTLLELLVVIGLLGLVAISITSLVIEDQGVQRQEVTEKRWDEIRKAIIGDTSRTLNGEPMLSGYVADMGRLPANLNELLELGDQPAWAELPLYDAIAGCTPSPCSRLTLGAGWRGPYLYTGGSKYFKDGWSSAETVDLNFDWAVTLTGASPAHSAIAVQSLGLDNLDGGTEYNADYPEDGINTVNANLWQLSTLPTPPTIQFAIHFNKAPLSLQNALELRVYYFQDDADVATSPADFIKNNEQVSDVLFSLPTTPLLPVPVPTSITYSPPIAPIPIPPPYLPLGKYAALVWCTQGTPVATDDVVYDGNCDSAQDSDVKPYYFTMLPSATPTIKIYWNTP